MRGAITNLEVSKEDFDKHLEEATDVVNLWPPWKQDVLGTAKPKKVRIKKFKGTKKELKAIKTILCMNFREDLVDFIYDAILLKLKGNG